LIAEDVLVIVCPRSHPLAEHGPATLADVADESLVELAPGSTIRQHLDRALREAKITYRSVAEVDSVPMVLDLVAHGMGIAIVPLASSVYNNELSYVHLSPPMAINHVVVSAAHPPSNPAAQAFLAQIRIAAGAGPSDTSSAPVAFMPEAV
jgi:DNA-binding transcriptional LysR family regulator